MSNYYVLVQDECNIDYVGDSNVFYAHFGTEDEVREEMVKRYEEALKYYEWPLHDCGEDGASLSEGDSCDYDCHISWHMMACPGFEPKVTNHILARGVAHEGGGITTEVLGAYGTIYDAERALMRAFGRELADPSEGIDYDPESCELECNHALATSETRDATVSFDILTVGDHMHDIINEIEHWFRYLG